MKIAPHVYLRWDNTVRYYQYNDPNDPWSFNSFTPTGNSIEMLLEPEEFLLTVF